MVKRNSSYMAENAESPQLRSFMTNISQWADQLAQLYPGIPPKDNPQLQPTAPTEEPKADTQMEPIDTINISQVSVATAIEPEEGVLIDIESKENLSKKSTVNKEDSDDSDVEVISSSAPDSSPPSNIPAIGQSHAPKMNSPFVANPFMPGEDDWMLVNNQASYEEMCKFYEAKRHIEETKRKELEGQIVGIIILGL